MRADVGKQGLVDEIERRGGAFDVQQDGTKRLVVQCHLKNGLTRTENKTVPGTPADSCDLPRYPCNAVSSPRDLETGESPESCDPHTNRTSARCRAEPGSGRSPPLRPRFDDRPAAGCERVHVEGLCIAP